MTSTIQQRSPNSTSVTTTPTTTSSSSPTMNWSTDDKNRFNCIDNIGLRQLWKLIALDSQSKRSTAKNEKISSAMESDSNFAEILSKRDLLPSNKMSLLKFLAINALELSAPAAPVLLQQGSNKPKGWVQLSGHPESIVPTATGIVRKRVSSQSDSEVLAYKFIQNDLYAKKIVPEFYGYQEINGDKFIELQDLLAGFNCPNVMDIKMGTRTFLESEVLNDTLRPDLYNKMISVDSMAPTEREHQLKAITKLRYMTFRETMSSSHTKGFRIEALRIRGGNPVTDLKKIQTTKQIQSTIGHFLNNRKNIAKDLIKRLRTIRSHMEKSLFFERHEIVGSSIFIVYDDERVGVWLIDFAKSRQLPDEIEVTHRQDWIPGNREEGLLKGMDELINIFENLYENYNHR